MEVIDNLKIQDGSCYVGFGTGRAGREQSNRGQLQEMRSRLRVDKGLTNWERPSYEKGTIRHARTHAQTHTRTHACTNTRTHARTHVRTHTHAHTHTHTYTHGEFCSENDRSIVLPITF